MQTTTNTSNMNLENPFNHPFFQRSFHPTNTNPSSNNTFFQRHFQHRNTERTRSERPTSNFPITQIENKVISFIPVLFSIFGILVTHQALLQTSIITADPTIKAACSLGIKILGITTIALFFIGCIYAIKAYYYPTDPSN